VIAHENITERQQTTMNLEPSEERYRSLFDLSPSPLLAYDVETLRFLAANKAAVEQYGFSKEEFLTMKVTEVHPPEDIPRLLEKIKEDWELGERTAGIWRHRKKDGTLINVGIVGRSMILGGRRAQVVSAIDVTDKLKTEEAGRAGEERLALALSASKMGVWDWDLRENTIFWSPECLELFGVNEFGGSLASFTALLHPEDAPAVLAAAKKAVEDHVDYAAEFRAKDSAGVVKWFSTLGRCDYDKEGKPLRLLGTIRDITKEKKAAVAVKDSELRLRMLFDQSPFGVLIYDPATKVPLDFNGTACRQLGYSCEEYARLRIAVYDALIAPEQIDALVQRVQREKLPPFETKHRTESGEIRDVQVIAQPMHLSDSTLVHCIVMDITERKRSSEQMRLQGAALQSAANAITIADSAGIIEWVNPGFTELTGYAPSEAIGTDLSLLDSGLRENALFNQMWRMVRAGKVWMGELVSKRKNGSLYDYQLTVAPVFDEKGKVSHFVAVQQDITKRKRAEHLLGQSRSKLREIHVRINGLREEERKQLSRNLHDHAGQFITALKFDIASASHNARSFPESEEKQVVLDKLASAQQLLGETHRDLARIAKTLRPAELNTSLLLALKAEIDQFAKRAKWKCSFNLPKKEMPLSDHAATMLFRIFQESITNVARHAGANAVHVTLIVAADVLGLEIKDNGRGFSPERTEASLGVLGMQERAGSLGGQVDIVTSDRGTSIKVSIPFSQNCT